MAPYLKCLPLLALMASLGPSLSGGGSVVGRPLRGQRGLRASRVPAISEQNKEILRAFLDITCDDEATAIHRVGEPAIIFEEMLIFDSILYVFPIACWFPDVCVWLSHCAQLDCCGWDLAAATDRFFAGTDSPGGNAQDGMSLPRVVIKKKSCCT
jgi:hypothetical protein